MSKGSGNVQTPKPEEYMPLVQQSADINRLNQYTPLGQTEYITPEGPSAMSWEDWSAENPATRKLSGSSYNENWSMGDGSNDGWTQEFTETPVNRSDYDAYVSQFEKDNFRQPEIRQSFSPEIQGMFDKQFDPNSYQNYADDYMGNARRLLDPVYDRQIERFQQTMANRGQPVGGELYDDTYKNLMDAQNSGYESAAFQGTQLADQKRTQDYNKLMAALGGSQVAYPQVDTMGAANMAMNANVANANNQANNSSSFWNTVPALGLTAYQMMNPQTAATGFDKPAWLL